MEVVDKKISYYFTNGILDIENTMTDYRNYIQAIIKRICTNLSNEDIEEIYIEVFFALWQNQFPRSCACDSEVAILQGLHLYFPQSTLICHRSFSCYKVNNKTQYHRLKI